MIATAGATPIPANRSDERRTTANATTTTRIARSTHGLPTTETPASGWSMTSQAAAARHRMPTPTRSAAGAGPRAADPAIQTSPPSTAMAAKAAASAPRPAVIVGHTRMERSAGWSGSPDRPPRPGAGG